ncbi:MAG TPA: glycoside hydrolase family 16 protein [Chitinophagaceae bacterium]|nr:glycoside hydrolase family 16 protein [Chitinophagaceae bacterium]
MNMIVLLILQMFLNACHKEALTAPQAAPAQYKLVWSDEFDSNGAPDPNKWRFETGFVRNEEAQWYQSKNAYCEGGNLVIEGRKERKPNPNYVQGSTGWRTNREFIEYTSSSVVMKQEHAFQYGKLEVRARIDTQTGLWPAIWTLGTSGEWPSNGEVDVMEYYDDRILANFAYGSATRYSAIWDEGSKAIASFGGALWANQFHIWTLEWDENTMRILIDGQLMNSIDLSQTINKSDGKNPFLQKHYLLLNLAMGGTRGGSLANTILPSKYMIDYVRIYQKQ